MGLAGFTSGIVPVHNYSNGSYEMLSNENRCIKEQYEFLRQENNILKLKLKLKKEEKKEDIISHYIKKSIVSN